MQSELLPEGVVDIEKGELHATYAPERSEVQLESLTLDLGGDTELVLDGSIGGVTPELIAAARDARPGDHVKGKLNANLKRVPPDRLAPLWPYAFSPGARRWVLANVRDGVIDEASAQLSLDIDPAGHTADLLDAQGTLRYRGLTVTYIDGLPPARQVDGIAKFADGHLVFLPSSGVVKGLKTNGGTLDISEIGSPLEWLTIDLPVNGSLQEALELIEFEAALLRACRQSRPGAGRRPYRRGIAFPVPAAGGPQAGSDRVQRESDDDGRVNRQGRDGPQPD